MKFRSKYGPELIIPLAVLLGYLLYLAVEQSNWAGVVVTGSVIVFFVYLFASTFYVIEEKKLFVNCGFVYRKIILVESINTIREVTDFFGAPAASIKRLQIVYNGKDAVAVSPKDKINFLATLVRLNPAIKIEL